MKLRNQFYIFQTVLTLILFLFLGLTYFSYLNQYEKDIEAHLNSEVDFHKKEIVSSVQTATSKLKKQRDYFKFVHKDVLEVLKENPNYDLEKLKKEIKSKYLSSHIDVELYLIDKSYVIYDSTFAKDIGFNLANIPDAKNYLDKTSKDGKVYISSFVSTDALDMKYKLYSYSKLIDNKYLELGFVDNTLTNTMEVLLKDDEESKTKVRLYYVSKDERQYIYYEMKKREDIASKDNTFTKISIDKPTKDNVINAVKQNKEIHIQDEYIHKVYINIFGKTKSDIMEFRNIVMELDIDVSEKLKFMEGYKQMFVVFLIIISIVLTILFLFIRNRFTTPVEKILSSLEKHKRIDDKQILSLNNELTDISNKYNTLFENLNLEIDKNIFLLNENKQFIADTVHQIRTPLTNIMMNGDMIKLYKNDSELSSFIEQIDSSINMLNNSYEDLAYITTYDSVEYKASKLSLSESLKYRIKFFDTISKVNKKEIVSNIDENIEFIINQIELERLIDNNISNAIKYATIDKAITINLIKNDEVATLTIKSFGNAIKEPSKLFDKNYREDKGKRGLGLGLYMVKNICNKYDIEYGVTYEDNQNIFTYRFKL